MEFNQFLFEKIKLKHYESTDLSGLMTERRRLEKHIKKLEKEMTLSRIFAEHPSCYNHDTAKSITETINELNELNKQINIVAETV